MFVLMITCKDKVTDRHDFDTMRHCLNFLNEFINTDGQALIKQAKIIQDKR